MENIDTVIIAVAVMTLGAAFLGAALGWASERFRVEGNPIIDQIERALPQTQCGQCGFPGCRGYAEAIADGEAINLCAPGGEAGARKLADLLGREIPTAGVAEKPPQFAVIDENRCIGCTLCIQACPVDAIVGAAKQLHTVVGSICTGCALCAAPCPVECIEMKTIAETVDNWKWKSPVFQIRRVA
ncbi:MAG: electron transport complex subunit RsxB [Candidatus Accumulibacter sp.]|jgi:electron transport complex protein RnfB|nr:electron transport complex subunit RsxB [Accumulibacter sp.]